MLFLPRQTFSKFYSQDSSLCTAVETIENTASLLSEQHYLNKRSKFSVLIWPWLKGRCGGDILIWLSSLDELSCWLLLPSADCVSIWVTLGQAKSRCLNLLIYQVGPGIPLVPPSSTSPLISRLRVEEDIGVNYKKVETWNKIPLKLHRLLQKHFQW